MQVSSINSMNNKALIICFPITQIIESHKVRKWPHILARRFPPVFNVAQDFKTHKGRYIDIFSKQPTLGPRPWLFEDKKPQLLDLVAPNSSPNPDYIGKVQCIAILKDTASTSCQGLKPWLQQATESQQTQHLMVIQQSNLSWFENSMFLNQPTLSDTSCMVLKPPWSRQIGL